MAEGHALVPVEEIADRIHTVRGQRVVLDADLAAEMSIFVVRAFLRLREWVDGSMTSR